MAFATMQHAEYTGMHDVITKESTVDMRNLFPDTGDAVRRMRNKVESNVRTLVRESRKEREKLLPAANWSTAVVATQHQTGLKSCCRPNPSLLLADFSS